MNDYNDEELVEALRLQGWDDQADLIEKIEAKLAKAVQFIQEVRRNGDTRLASMAIAVLAELEGKE